MKAWIKKYQIIVASVVSTLILFGMLSATTLKIYDWRLEKSDTIVGIRRELVFLNCMFRCSLTDEQQKKAEILFKQVDGVCKR